MRILVILFLVSFAAGGQPFEYRGSAYGYFAVGGCQHSYVIVGGGAGGEAFVFKGLSVGVEGGAQNFGRDWTIGEAYVLAGYHFVNRSRVVKWDPFVSVAPLGIAVGRGGYGVGVSLGGGTNYWVKPRLGIRFEFRTHAYSFDEVTGQGRIGITFR